MGTRIRLGAWGFRNSTDPHGTTRRRRLGLPYECLRTKKNPMPPHLHEVDGLLQVNAGISQRIGSRQADTTHPTLHHIGQP
jgi:hypothetical protein